MVVYTSDVFNNSHSQDNIKSVNTILQLRHSGKLKHNEIMFNDFKATYLVHSTF